MTDWPCHVWLQKKISMNHQQGSLGGVLQTLMRVYLITKAKSLLRENGIYQ